MLFLLFIFLDVCLLIRHIFERHRSYVIHRTSVTVLIEHSFDKRTLRGLLDLLLLLSKHTLQTAGIKIIFLFLFAEITHHNRCKKHKNLGDLTNAQTALLANLLCNLTLIAAENMT